MSIILILIGVLLEIAKANQWFIVPDLAIYIPFILGIILFLYNLIVINRINNMTKKFKKW